MRLLCIESATSFTSCIMSRQVKVMVYAQAHSARSKMDMTARENFPEPRNLEVVTVKPNKQAVGKAFKAKGKEIQAALEALGEEDALCLQVCTQALGHCTR